MHTADWKENVAASIEWGWGILIFLKFCWFGGSLVVMPEQHLPMSCSLQAVVVTPNVCFICVFLSEDWAFEHTQNQFVLYYISSFNICYVSTHKIFCPMNYMQEYETGNLKTLSGGVWEPGVA